MEYTSLSSCDHCTFFCQCLMRLSLNLYLRSADLENCLLIYLQYSSNFVVPSVFYLVVVLFLLRSFTSNFLTFYKYFIVVVVMFCLHYSEWSINTSAISAGLMCMSVKICVFLALQRSADICCVVRGNIVVLLRL